MLVVRPIRFVLVAVLVFCIGACQAVGPTAIGLGRNQYSSVLQSTAKQQTFANIIGVHNHQPTSFVDVVGVDATTTMTATSSGTLAGIGSKPGTFAELGSVTAGGTYTETPIVHYQPLQGASLVAQLVTPVGIDVLEDLFDSSWKIAPLLDLSTSFITLDTSELYPALNIIIQLSEYNALTVAATKSDLTDQGSGKGSGSGSGSAAAKSKSGSSGGGDQGGGNSAKGSTNDSLTIYLNPFHRYTARSGLALKKRELQLWIRLLWLYAGTQQKFTPPNLKYCTDMHLSANSESELRSWDQNLASNRPANLDEFVKCLPNSIELRNATIKPTSARNDGLISGAPLIKTYSAVGILKNATETPGPKIAFVDPEKYREIIGYDWNKSDVDNASYYTLLPQSEDPADNPATTLEDKQIDSALTSWLTSGKSPILYDTTSSKVSVDEYLKMNHRLGSLRRYILVITSAVPPVGAYVSYFTNGQWYYIDGADEISQKNFNLIALFLTMMAIPSAVPQVTPTISVGG